ncbi:MAG TPA: TM0106 family RecB-like putative nuclease, partial [Candidatus Dormibacteraeota bacterium]|nr:TM0106 family RecB-like putative nuclease [Candidatus Dormibacteraeota bacterium]
MQLVEGTLVLSASDLTHFLDCDHLTELERRVVMEGLERPVERTDEEIELLRRLGDEHERAYLHRLESSGRRVVVIEREGDGEGIARLQEMESRTLAAMRSGADYIYQAGFFDGRWYGRADFLRRVDTPSDLGDWSYECEDAKLARSLKVGALVQLAEYSRQLTRMQGRAPESVHVVLGSQRVESCALSEVSAYADAARDRLEATLRLGRRDTYPVQVSHCRMCRWQDVCTARWREDDHLTLVAGVHRSQVAKLAASGVTTVASLAERTMPVAHLSDATVVRLQRQAALQQAGRDSDHILYELLDGDDGSGLAALPEPSEGDVFFDMEGDNFAGPEGLEYLFGVVELADGAPTYRPFWGHDSAGERTAFESFIDYVMARLREHPAMHVYHYAAYEPNALKRLAGRYGTREDEVDRLLRGRVLVDLYTVVRRSLQASTDSYALKTLEPLFMDDRGGRITSGTSSIVAYERWLQTGDPDELQDIADYNFTDCRSTLQLRGWLERLRGEYESTSGSTLPRPSPGELEPSPENAAVTAETHELVRRLTADVPVDPAACTQEQEALVLLANVLDWHRREQRPEWWEYFARLEKNEEALRDDTHAVAGLEPVGPAVVERGPELQEYAFDPAQETRVEEGDDSWVDPATGNRAGTVVSLDRVHGRLTLRRTARAVEQGHPAALVPGKPVSSEPLRKAVRRVGAWVA